MFILQYNSDQMAKLSAGLPNLKDAVLGAMYEAVFSTILDIRNTAKSPGYVPVKTGDLKRSIDSKVERGAGQVTGYVGSNKDYARIHEFGGRAGRNHSVFIQPKYYFTRAIQENQEKTKSKFQKLLALKKIAR